MHYARSPSRNFSHVPLIRESAQFFHLSHLRSEKSKDPKDFGERDTIRYRIFRFPSRLFHVITSEYFEPTKISLSLCRENICLVENDLHTCQKLISAFATERRVARITVVASDTKLLLVGRASRLQALHASTKLYFVLSRNVIQY